MRSIVVGTDGSKASERAITEAGELARFSGRPITVVFVRQSGLRAAAGVFSPQAVGTLEEAFDCSETIAEAMGITALDLHGVSWKFVVRSGQPATELIRVAAEEGADVIVVAGRRHGAFGSIAHASVTSQLLHRWPHSLLVVRPGHV